MSEKPNHRTETGARPENFSEAEIDALLQSAAASGGTDSAAATGAIQQEDIDVLLKAGGLPGDAPASAPLPNGADSIPALAAYAPTPVQPYDFESLSAGAPSQVDPKRVSMLGDVNLRVKVQLGQTRMLVEEVLKLGEGSVVELDKLAGDPVDILVNDRLIARGEVLVLNDNFCVRVSEVLSNNPHRVTM